MELFSTVTLTLISLFIYLLYKSTKIPKNFPPGPGRLPFFGALLSIPQTNGVLVAAANWFIKQYGKLVGIYLGYIPAVVVYDYEIAKELFSQDVSAGRPKSFVYKYRMLGGKKGLMFNDGESWKSQRRYALKTLKDFGFGKKGLEDVLIEEADRMADYFREQDGKPTLVLNMFNVAILNVLWQIVANYRFELTDPRAANIVKLITESIQIEKLRYLFALPILRYILPEESGWNKQKESVEETYALMRDIVKQHKETFDEENPRDFIDMYLKEIKSSPEAHFDEEQLLVTTFDLFSAGSETTATTLAWAVCYMITNPEVQTKVQQEIDEVLGDRPPSLDDRGQLSFTEATIMEIQRLGSIAPMAVPHRALSDINIRGYKIPKDTMIWSMLYYMMRDPDYWKDPEDFKPERFLGEDGKVIKEERFIPYGIGKRYCLGESLARTELFIIFTRLLQLFTFKECPGCEKVTNQPLYAFIMSPKPFYANAVPRS